MQFLVFALSLMVWNIACAEGVGNFFGAPGYGYYGNSPYGYGGMNGFPGGYGYPSLQNPQQRNMALLYSLLAKARQSNNPSQSKANQSGTSSGNSPTIPDFSNNLESFGKSIAAGQKALAEASKPIPEVDLSPVFSALSNRNEQPRPDPLAGLSESLKTMNEQTIKTIQQVFPPIAPSETQKRILPNSNAIAREANPNIGSRISNGIPAKPSSAVFRGIASETNFKASPATSEPIMHRNLHGEGNHGTTQEITHAHTRSPRIVPYE